MRVFNNLLKDVNIFKKEKERKGKKEKEKRKSGPGRQSRTA